MINTGRLVQKVLLKQAYIDKVLKVIQRKVLKGTYLPVTVEEIQAGYLVRSHFKDIYLYLAQNKLPTTKIEIKKVEMLAERYILLDSLLFKIVIPQKKKWHYWPYQKYVQIKLSHCIIPIYLQDNKES